MKNKLSNTRTARFDDVEILQNRIAQETPKSGEYFYDYKLQEAKKQSQLIDEQDFHTKYKINFTDLPISQQTIKGLTNRKFVKMTEVQRCTISHALADRDVLVCSRTGSGKTLAYLIPLVEKLYRQKFIPFDGLGAIVLVPVRQLAMQVFEVLNSFTEKMEISVGLIIGGKDVKFEQERIKMMNILVCTPGRLLQHLEETYGFQTSNLQMIVLDEADQMLEMGFKEPLNQILTHLPRCQTLFFSATLTKEIHSLSKLCMNEPERIFLHSVSADQIQESHAEGKTSVANLYETPAKLMQYYMIVEPEDRLNTLFSFLKFHQKQKILIFTSTCKQVRFIYESFRKFKLGCPLYELQGHQKQKKRMAIYFTFCQKRYGILVCTNIASRGLDFPLIDWVIQLDLPDNLETYVHRVGRTARFKAEGKAITFVADHEKGFIDELKQKKINVHKIAQNPQKYLRVESSLQSICSEHQDVKYLAQRALISYIKYIYKSGNKKIFNLNKINLEALAKSYGLPNAPNVNIKTNKDQSEGEEDEEKLTKIEKLRLKAKMKKSQIKQSKLTKKQQDREQDERGSEEEQPDNDDNQFLKIKSKVFKRPQDKPILTTSKRQLKKIKDQGHFEGKNKIFFDEDLKPIANDEYRKQKYLKANKEKVEYNIIDEMEERIEQNKQEDEAAEKLRRKVKRKKINEQIQAKKRNAFGGGAQYEVQLGSEPEQQE